MLVIARKRGLIANVPEIEWLKVPAQEFDFLDDEETKRLLAAVDVQPPHAGPGRHPVHKQRPPKRRR